MWRLSVAMVTIPFYEASKLAAGDASQLKVYVKTVVANHIDAGRPKRDRKPRVISDPSSY